MAGQEVLQGSEVTFSDNSFITGNGHAFAKLCTVDRLSWHNNTILTSNDMPLRLQVCGGDGGGGGYSSNNSSTLIVVHL